MAIAYSFRPNTDDNPPLWVQSISGATTDSLMNGLHTVFTEVGIPYETFGNGWQYTLVSPQDQTLTCKVRVTDIGTPPGGQSQLRVQFLSADEERLGYPHPLIAATGRSYEAHVSKTQIFTGLTDFSSDRPEGLGWGLAVCGGVPYIPDLPLLCLDNPVQQEPDITEAWWSSGSDNNALSSDDGFGFRSSWRNKWAWDGALNEQYAGGFTNPEDSVLRLAVLATPFPDYSIFLSAQQTRWWSGRGLYIEPLLMWGKTRGALCKVRGQIWDAVLVSKDNPLGDEITTEEFNPSDGDSYGNFVWRNYMHYQGDMSKGASGSYYSSLYLLKGTISGEAGGLESNYAY